MKSSPPGALKRREPAARDRGAGTAARGRAPFARLETRIKELRPAASGPGTRARAAKADTRRPRPVHGARRSEQPGADPKGGDLCAATAKPAERLVEAGSGSDVQILPRSCAKGRKTHRTA